MKLDLETMLPSGEKTELIHGDPHRIGYERVGEDNSTLPASEEEVEAGYQAFVKRQGVPESMIPAHLKPLIRGMFSKKPFIEGAWMDRHCGKYYLQYACPGAQYNTYADGVYVSDSPLGPFTLAKENPYSYKPGGFLPGAGHGSTMQDQEGSWWHAATMRISVNHDFERRVGLWPAGFDEDGQMFCNQRYGDWPMSVPDLRKDPWKDPEWMLLSVNKSVSASSFTEGHEPEKASEENVRSFWQAASNGREEWLQLDLEKVFNVHAVQINFADARIDIPCPGQIRPGSQARYIEEASTVTQWKLEASEDGENWFTVEDRHDAETDLSHDLIVCEEGFSARFFRLSDLAVPYAQAPCVSGLRGFGKGCGKAPEVPRFTAKRLSGIDMTVSVSKQEDALGYNILFGSSPGKLYHSYMVFSAEEKRIGALIEGRDYYVRVDAFNENGITEGVCVPLK